MAQDTDNGEEKNFGLESVKIRADVKGTLESEQERLRLARRGKRPPLSEVIQLMIDSYKRELGSMPEPTEDDRICEAVRQFLREYRRDPTGPLDMFHGLIMAGLKKYL